MPKMIHENVIKQRMAIYFPLFILFFPLTTHYIIIYFLPLVHCLRWKTILFLFSDVPHTEYNQSLFPLSEQ